MRREKDVLLDCEDDSVIDDERLDEVGGSELRITKVQGFIDDFVHEGAILPQTLFAQQPTKISDHLE